MGLDGTCPDFNFSEVATPYARTFMWLDAEAIRWAILDQLHQLLESINNTLLKMPSPLERNLVQLETGQFVINLVGLSASAQRLFLEEWNGAETAFPIALALMFIHVSDL
jgi:hypothetical protein